MSNEVTNTAHLYMQAVEKLSKISPNVLKKVLEKAVRGDKHAQKKIVEVNLKLVIPIANKYVRPGLDLLDLIEEGNLGLMRAIEKYNPKKKVKFSTYATHWIEEFIRRAVITQTQMIQLPFNICYDLHKCLEKLKLLQEQLGRNPTLTELSKKLHLSMRRIKMLLSISNFSDGHSSLDTPLDEEEKILLEDTLSDNIVNSPDSIISLIKLHDEFDTVLDKRLTKKEKKVIVYYFGLSGEGRMSLSEVGKKLNITRERVRQLEQRALNKLRIYVQQKGWI